MTANTAQDPPDVACVVVDVMVVGVVAGEANEVLVVLEPDVDAAPDTVVEEVDETLGVVVAVVTWVGAAIALV